MGSNYLIKCLFVFLTLWVKFNPLHSRGARVVGGLCNGCVKGLVRWNSSFPVRGSRLLRAAPVPQTAALPCAFATPSWESQWRSPRAIYKDWSSSWCSASAVYNFSCSPLTECLPREKGALYCTRELKNSKKEHFPDCATVDDADVAMVWNIPDFQVSDIEAETFHIDSEIERKRYIWTESVSDIFNLSFFSKCVKDMQSLVYACVRQHL